MTTKTLTPRARKMAEKRANKRIERLYYASCSGVTIPLYDIPKVFAAGRVAVDAGGDDAAVTKAIVAFVETIRKN